MKFFAILVALLAFVRLPSYANLPGKINFAQGLSWDQIKAKASAEKKYIFVDCYATWCMPCRKMDQEVYTNSEVADFINDHFISVKVQGDTTNSDEEDVRRWYGDAHRIMKDYGIRSFPGFLFLSPEGTLVHQGVGFQPAPYFLGLLRQALDPEQQYYTLFDKFHRQTLTPEKMPILADKLNNIGRRKEAMEVARFYIEEHLLKSGGDSLVPHNDLLFIGYHIQDSKSLAFRWFYLHSSRIDSLIGGHFSQKILDRVISLEEIKPAFTKWTGENHIKVRNREWSQLMENIKRKYDQEYADRIMLDGQISWYSKTKQWDKAIRYNAKKIEKYGLDTAGNGSIYTNNMLYSGLFMHCTNKRIITIAVGWAKIISDGHPGDGGYMDTYANLLYKKGDVNLAIELEKTAHYLAPEEKEIEVSLGKMKKGQPTWSAD
jgi:thioredoxin-related protein